MSRSIRAEGKSTKTPSGKVGSRIYAWPVIGTTRVAGAAAKYTVLLWSTGELSCDCPGWIFYHKKNGGCKHTSNVTSDSQSIFRLWEQGKELPSASQETDPGVEVINAVNPRATLGDEHSKIRYGRYIQLD